MAHQKRAHGTHGNGTCSCGGCGTPQLARNHYFDGKLMVGRDFTDEQRYFLGKDRRHAQVLHGWGTACGLKVRQHPQESCRDRYVVIEPGTALDCCGREIVVRCEEVYDFRRELLAAWRRARIEAGEEPDDDAVPEGEHDFQVCLRYRECPTEEIPALFDDCGCHGDGCEPNRILESFDLDVILDPEIPPAGPVGDGLDWVSTLHFAGVAAVAHHEGSGRLYLLTGEAPANLYQLSARTGTVLESRSFPGFGGGDLAVSADGTRVYALVREDGGSERRILVLRSDDLAGEPVRELSFAADPPLRIAAAPDGRLYATFPNLERLRVWGSDVNQPGSPAAPDEIDLSGPSGGAEPGLIAVSPSGRWAYAASGERLWIVDTSDLTVAETVDTPAGEQLHDLSIASREDEGDDLALIYLTSDSTSELRLVAFRPARTPAVAPLGDPVEGLVDPPFAVAYSPSARWVYVQGASADSFEGYVQAVDAAAVERGVGDAVGPALRIDHPRGIALGGDRLYVPFGDADDPDASGVAVIEALGEDCCDLLDRVLDPCPDCSDGGECVVLATVVGYAWGDRVVDPPAEAEALEVGPGDGEAWIDNRLGRRLLASTQLLTEIVECLCAHAGQPGEPGRPGEDGEDGAPGENGEDGAGIDDVEVEFVPCDEEGSATLDPPDADPRTLHLVIPSCCVRDLTRICGINWNHRRAITLEDLDLVKLGLPEALFGQTGFHREGLVVAFDGDVLTGDLDSHSFRVFTPGFRPWVEAPREPFRIQWSELFGFVFGIRLVLEPRDGAGCEIVRIEEIVESTAPANGAVFLPFDVVRNPSFFGPTNRVEIHGDLIRDVDGKAIDADHLPPWLPDRPTGDHISGGLFESWFTIPGDDDETDSRIPFPGDLTADTVDLNRASRDELSGVEGLTSHMVDGILERREARGPFRSLDELTDVGGIARKTVDKVRGRLRLGDPRSELLQRLRSLKGGSR